MVAGQADEGALEATQEEVVPGRDERRVSLVAPGGDRELDEVDERFRLARIAEGELGRSRKLERSRFEVLLEPRDSGVRGEDGFECRADGTSPVEPRGGRRAVRGEDPRQRAHGCSVGARKEGRQPAIRGRRQLIGTVGPDER